MNGFRSRIDKLEACSGIGLYRHTASVREIFAPSPDGPVSGGICVISVFGSDQRFSRNDYGTEAGLIAAADTEHQRIHGKPLAYAEGSAA